MFGMKLAIDSRMQFRWSGELASGDTDSSLQLQLFGHRGAAFRARTQVGRHLLLGLSLWHFIIGEQSDFLSPFATHGFAPAVFLFPAAATICCRNCARARARRDM